MTWRPHAALSETEDFLNRCEREWIDGAVVTWTMWLQDGGAFAGVIGADARGTGIQSGYALCRRWWRQGLMPEALRWITDWALAQPDVYRVWPTCDVENAASGRLLERVGMECEGVLRRWIVHPRHAALRAGPI